MAFDVYSVPVTRIDGTVGSMAEFKGKVLLVVNVASKCGLTPQYEGLEAIQRRFADRGFSVLGVPANDFAGQEPGTDAEIQAFCTGNFGTTFPMFSKVRVVGENKHPLYAEMIERQPVSTGESKGAFREGLIQYGIAPNDEPELLWNFEKFLIAKDGAVVARFSPDTLPEADVVLTAVETELRK